MTEDGREDRATPIGWNRRLHYALAEGIVVTKDVAALTVVGGAGPGLEGKESIMTGGNEGAGATLRTTGESSGDLSGSSPQQEFATGISAFGLINALLRHIALVGLIAALTTVGGVLWGATRPEIYSAQSSFFPNQESASQSRLATMAAQFGMAGISGGGGQGIAFYRELVTSREMRTAVVTSIFPEGEGRSLVEIYEIPGGPPDDLRASAAAAELQENLTVITNPDAGLLSIATRSKSAELATAINARILNLVAEFNLEKRQSQGAAERRFVEERRAEAEQTLVEAEAELRTFLENNRSFQTSPQLIFEHNRLQRRVQLQQELYASLSQAYEQARLAEIRDTPVLTIIDPPRPTLISRPRPLFWGVVGAVGGSALALTLVFGVEYLRRQRYEYPGHFEEFTDWRRKAGTSKPARWLRRLKE